MLDGYLGKVCVIGAGGKIGRGIALLLLHLLCRLPDPKSLLLIDTNPKALGSLKDYFLKRGIDWSRAEKIVRFSENITDGKDYQLIFEAILEDAEVKAHAFRTLSADSNGQSYYFTSTSSIPIGELSERAKLNGRLIGAHFYNPPVVQKLLEVIPPTQVIPELIQLTEELAMRLGKTVVFSKDIAGFIGNGHFVRELLYSTNEVHSSEQSLPVAIAALNKVTQEFLVRPMGIFHLVDFLGVDVCSHLCRVMTAYHPEGDFQDPLLDRMIAEGAIGGQWEDGMQKDGFFRYENGSPIAVYSLEERNYLPLPDLTSLGSPPKGYFSWKALYKNPKAGEILNPYIENLLEDQTPGSQMAQSYLAQSGKIAQLLVDQGVARSLQDVDTVLRLGFHHLLTFMSPKVPHL